MKWNIMPLVVAVALVQSTWAAYVVKYDFDDMVEGPIAGQDGWSAYDTEEDSVARNKNAFSVKAGAGTLEEATDGALIVRATDEPIRCVSGEPVLWKKGESLKVEFDFRLVVEPQKLTEKKPVMVLYIGNALLDEKARWEVRLDATPTGNWVLSAAMPGEKSDAIYATRLLIPSEDVTVASDWYRLVVTLNKRLSQVSINSSVMIYDKTGRKVVALRCADIDTGKVVQEMWNLRLAHVGFYSDKDIYGEVSIDNLTLSAKKWGNQLGF